MKAKRRSTSQRGVHKDRKMYEPVLHETKLKGLLDIIGTQPKLKIYSPSATNMPQQFSDLELCLRLYDGRIPVDLAGNRWLVAVLRPEFHVALRAAPHPPLVKGQWKWACGHVPDSMGIGWPLRELNHQD